MLANTTIIDGDEPCALTSTKHRLRPKTIGYDPLELREMVNQHDHRYKVLPIEAIKTIRMLRLNHEGR